MAEVSESAKTDKRLISIAYYLHIWLFIAPGVILLGLFLVLRVVTSYVLFSGYHHEVVSNHQTVERYVSSAEVGLLIEFLCVLWAVTGLTAVVLLNVVVFKNQNRSKELTIWMIVTDASYAIWVPLAFAVAWLIEKGTWRDINWIMIVFASCFCILENVGFFKCERSAEKMLDQMPTYEGDTFVESIITNQSKYPPPVAFEEL